MLDAVRLLQATKAELPDREFEVFNYPTHEGLGFTQQNMKLQKQKIFQKL